MKKKISFLLIFLSTVGFWGCRSLYTPTTPNIPLFQNKSDFQIESSIFTNGINGKIAFSPVQHIGILLNGQYSYNKHFSQPQYHYYTECAAGYYFDINKNQIGEAYLGYGAGDANYGDPLSGNFYALTLAKGYYNKMFSQVNWGYISPKGNALGSCIRLADVIYTYTYSPNITSLTNNTFHHLSFEPYIYLKLKLFKNLSLVNYLGATLISKNNRTIRTNLINYGIGLRLNFQKNDKAV